MKKIFLLIAISLLIIPSSSYAQKDSYEIESKELDESVVKNKKLPYRVKKKGTHFKRKRRLSFHNTGIRHKTPYQYLLTIEPDKKRTGLSENMMIGLYSNFRSKYMSKEQPDSYGPVWQPSGTIELYGAGLNVWSNFVLNEEANQGEFNEVDFTLYYTAHIEHLTIHPYIMYMVFPNGDPASLDYSSKPILETDLYVEYTLWKLYFFSLMRAQVKGGTPGAIYANVGMGIKEPVGGGMTLEASALLNFGNDIYLSAKYGDMCTNIDAISLMLGFTFNPWKGLTFRPHMDFAVHVVPKIRERIKNISYLDNFIVWGGMDVAYNF